jgi:hypothetical protein
MANIFSMILNILHKPLRLVPVCWRKMVYSLHLEVWIPCVIFVMILCLFVCLSICSSVHLFICFACLFIRWLVCTLLVVLIIFFYLAVNWAKVRFMMFQGQMNLAVIYLDRVSL